MLANLELMSAWPPAGTRPDADPRQSILAKAGVAAFDAATLRRCAGLDDLLPSDLEAFARSWDDLPLDGHMGDGGRYRRRRHAVFSGEPDGGPLRREAHRPHFQERTFNGLNGGVARNFAPILPETEANAAMQAVMGFAANVAGACRPDAAWQVEAHQFRIEAGAEPGKPTPEGLHRDGVDFVLITLVGRTNVEGGDTTIVLASGEPLARLTLADPFDSVFLDDRRVLHGVGSIRPREAGRAAIRDVLVLTFRRERNLGSGFA